MGYCFSISQLLKRDWVVHPREYITNCKGSSSMIPDEKLFCKKCKDKRLTLVLVFPENLDLQLLSRTSVAVCFCKC